MHFSSEALVSIIFLLIGSQGFWALIMYKMQKRDEKKDIRARADLVILHDLVYKYTRKAIARGYTTFYEFDNTSRLYQIYVEYGGNGTGTQLYEEFCQLPKRYDMTGDKENGHENNKGDNPNI